MNHESALTPFLLKAYQIYKCTFGLTPKIFADITIDTNGMFAYEVFPSSTKNISNLTFLFIFFIISPLWIGTPLVLLKLLYMPTKTSISILQTIVVLLVFFDSLLGVISYVMYIRNR